MLDFSGLKIYEEALEMNAAVVRSYDAPPSYTTFEDPVAGERELLVTVTAAGLHPIVKSLANGTHYGSTGVFPFVPGVDGVGRLEDGRRVYFGVVRPPFGSFAEKTVTGMSMCVQLPDGLPDEAAAGLANPGMSSWAALTARAKFVAGESVLILGATGSAGRLAIQIAKRMGARRVVAAGRNPEALEKLKGLGADAVISLAGATLRSSGLELLGSGFGSASMTEIFAAIGEMFKEAAKTPFVNSVRTVALKDVGELWATKEEGVRLVFRP